MKPITIPVALLLAFVVGCSEAPAPTVAAKKLEETTPTLTEIPDRQGDR